ncbi:MAG: tandem-95 repeat protein [Planctomycetales bacterium]|nr:tandem-95 repeat protein [Planctomycetales bacterium]
MRNFFAWRSPQSALASRRRQRRARSNWRSQPHGVIEALETRTVLSATTDTGVTPSAAPPETARLILYVDGQQQTIPANVGVFSGGGNADIFSSSADGELTFDPDNNSTLGDFFDVWRTNAGLAGNNVNATLSASELLGNLSNATGDTVQMFVNGNASTEFDNYVVQAGDEIIVAYGANPIVSLNTTYGSIVIELFEQQTPGTVDNFLNYVNDGDYINSIFHRSAKLSGGADFVIQGGGFRTTSTTFTSTAQFSSVPTDPPIQNEPGISNLRGTVAMAKTSNPDSATSQFFVNLNDANTFLDSPSNSGGFTVFGQVLDMTSSDRIASLPVDMSNGSPFGELPYDSNDLLAVVQSVAGLGQVTGVKFRDANSNGAFETGEELLAGVTIYVDANNNGVHDSGEISTTTDAQGRYLLQLEPGDYTLRSELTTNRASTVPVNPDSYPVTIEIGRTNEDFDFGESPLDTPSSVDLLAGSDTGGSNTDNLTRLNNASASQTLQFQVNGVNNGATVRLFSDGTLIGSAVASGNTVIVTTNGATSLTNGPHSITATQTVSAVESVDSPALSITIDATAPAAISSPAPDVAQAGQLYSFNAESTSEGLSGIAYSLVGAPSGMTINAATGQVSWVPAANQAVPQSFDIQISDTAGNTAAQHVELNVLGVIPALADSYTTAEDVVLTVNAANGVLANDGDSGSSSLTATLVDAASNGTVSLSANGSFTYTPNANFFGSDSFTYRASDGVDDSNVARVSIQVTSVADAPVAAADNFSASNDGAQQTFAVLANDTSEPDGVQTLSITGITQGSAGGTVAINGDQILYTAATGFVGTETFTYTIEDSDSLTDTATVTVSVAAPADNVVSGFVYLDADNDGNRDSAEVGVPGAVITLAGTDSAGGSVSRTTMTGSNGFYQFAEVPSGTYTLTESQPTALSDGQDTTPIADAVVTNDSFANIVLTGGQSLGENNFGERNLMPQYFSIAWFFASAQSQEVMLRESIAVGEEMAGHVDLAAAIRAGATETPVIPNTGPQSASDSYSVIEDGTLSATVANGVLANDVDAEGDSLTAALVASTTNGQLTFHADGSFTYSPNADFSGSDSFSYRANDGEFNSETTTVSIDVTPVNDAPASAADNYSVDAGSVLNVSAANGVLDNDTDTEDDALTAQLVDSPAHGSVSLATDGSFAYTPDSGFAGTDTFTYRANDGAADSATATVTIVVNQVNHAPVATADSYTASQDTQFSVTAAQGLLASDSDADSDTLTASLVTSTSNGTLTLAADGSFTYIPATGFIGTDSFLYQASDGELTSNQATVTIVVQRTNDAPVAVDDTYAATEDSPRSPSALTGVLANDTDGDGDTLSAVIVSGPANGSVTLNTNGSFTYTPNANFNGTDTFTYQADDGLATSNTATVTINVAAVNDAPTAADDDYQVAVDGTLAVITSEGLLANDADIEGSTLTVAVVNSPANGVLNENGDGSFTYTPNTGFHGLDTFTYRADDGAAQSSLATVSITVNSAPSANADSFEMDEDQSLSVDALNGVLANDTDPDDDTLTASVVTNPEHGSLSFSADGSFSYTPDANFSGVDTFTYRVHDGFADSAPATVSIAVSGVADAPVAVADSYTTNEDTPLSVNIGSGVLANDTDADGDTLAATLVTGPANGAVSLDSDGSFLYTPNANFNGSDSFTYRAGDGAIDSDETVVTIAINSVDDAPHAADDTYTVEEDRTLSVDAVLGVLDNDTDGDNDSLTAILVDNPSEGAFTLNSDGSFIYTPFADFEGTDSFTYRVSDGTLLSNTATVSIVVTPQNVFSVAENSPAGTLIGEVTAEGNLNAQRIFTFDDPSLASQLELVADDHLSGDPSAPVVLIEYLDLQCPICRAYHPIVQQLEDDFVGDLLVVRRHFPLENPHPNAFAAAIAAEAAGRQGEFDAMVDLLFEKQPEWSGESDPQSFFTSYATTLGLDLTQFASDSADTALVARVQRDLDAAVALNAPGTPTFFLGGEQIATLPQTQQEFSDLIVTELINNDDIFALNRLTGELFVHEPAAFDFEASASLSVDVRIVDLAGTVETPSVVVNLLDVDETPSAAPPEDPFADSVDAAFAEDDWL